MTTNPPPTAEEVEAMRERLSRWLQNTGFDGGEHSPPVLALTMLATLAAENEGLRAGLRPFARAAEAIDEHDPEWPDEGAALRASFDWWARPHEGDDVGKCYVSTGDLRRARTLLERKPVV